MAHKQHLGGKCNTTVQRRRAEKKKSIKCKPDSSQGRQRSLQCYRYSATIVKVMGHRQCATKISPSENQKGSSTSVSQSCQKKTRAMVAQLCEDGKKALTCVKVEGTRSKGNLKKSTEESTSNEKVVYSAVCRAQSNDGQTYTGVGRLNRLPVKTQTQTGGL